MCDFDYEEFQEEKPYLLTSFAGVGAFSIITIVFVILKLCNVVNWSWFWVLFPTILSLGAVFLLAIASLIAYIIVRNI